MSDILSDEEFEHLLLDLGFLSDRPTREIRDRIIASHRALRAENELLQRANIALESEKSMLTLQLAGADMPAVQTWASTSTDEPDTTLYVQVECPECKRLRAENEQQFDVLKQTLEHVSEIEAENERLRDSLTLQMEEVDRLYALRERNAKLEKVAEAAKAVASSAGRGTPYMPRRLGRC